MLEALTTVFVPVFFKTLAILCGIGGGIIFLLLVGSLIILALHPITKRL